MDFPRFFGFLELFGIFLRFSGIFLDFPSWDFRARISRISKIFRDLSGRDFSGFSGIFRDSSGCVWIFWDFHGFSMISRPGIRNSSAVSALLLVLPYVGLDIASSIIGNVGTIDGIVGSIASTVASNSAIVSAMSASLSASSAS